MSIPLPICLENLVPLAQTPKGQTSIRLLRKILTNVVKSPHEAKFRKLNATKLMPKLAAENLAPIYIIEHAGFTKDPAGKYILPGDADLTKISTIVQAIDGVTGGGTPGASGGGASDPYAGLSKKEREELEWKQEQKRLEIQAEKRKKERDARRAKEAEERKKAEEAKRAEEAKKAEEATAMEVENAKAETEQEGVAEENTGEDKENNVMKVDEPEREGELGEHDKKDKQKEKSSSVDVSKLPPKSSLDTKLGSKKGEVQVVNDGGKPMVYQWNGDQWTCVGEAMDVQEKPDEELDDDMKDIVKRLKAGKSFAGAPAKKKKSKKPANFAQMTLEEKHAYAVKEREKKQRALERQREKNRKEVGKAAVMLAEQTEWQKLQAAAAAKRKAEKESRRAKKKLLARMKRERAQRNKEIAEENKRLLAEQAERRRQQGLK
eukprot:CAMPEP_0170192236 /NCGR_PEP_ID=MMETSP0040_2-20121228/53658_1 /TAXON_ID=641309 /ORGANISM="Lotharella oceanica, Strain CCMP622" /LENGTH=434 /DNA_ID=CAMNT_0010440533 /DNA_START=1 /DNA_END=1305 /DNA_ORIENTATION=+